MSIIINQHSQVILFIVKYNTSQTIHFIITNIGHRRRCPYPTKKWCADEKIAQECNVSYFQGFNH